jgi:DICT domain-containing protein
VIDQALSDARVCAGFERLSGARVYAGFERLSGARVYAGFERLSDARVYAGFERLSRLGPVEARYARITDVASEVWVIGEPDHTPSLPKARQSHVTRGPLPREWFLPIVSSRYGCLITARDLDGLEMDRPVMNRRLEGLETSSREVVSEVDAALRASLGA